PSSTLLPYTTLFRSHHEQELGVLANLTSMLGEALPSSQARCSSTGPDEHLACICRLVLACRSLCLRRSIVGKPDPSISRQVPLRDRKSTRLNSSHDQ